MPIEAATYIADLNAANPLSGGVCPTGDHHDFRLAGSD